MIGSSPASERALPNVIYVNRLEELGAITNDTIGGAVWQRPLPQDFQDWIEALDPEKLPSARAVLPPDELRTLVTSVCDAANTPSGPLRDWFIDDVCKMAEAFIHIMATPFLQLRFDVVSDNACRKFHMDMVRARLICTYRGRGTQYGISDGPSHDPDFIHEAKTGEPILLRGRRWPLTGPVDLLHRSPPISGSGKTRLILVLDAIETMNSTHTTTIAEAKRRLPPAEKISTIGETV